MSPELGPDLPLEIAHVLLIDAVGYSKLLVNEQIELLQELNQIVRSTECFRTAEKTGKLIRVPTGDGMAVLFFHSPEEPVRCALEISKALQEYPHIQLRMGVHSGPVSGVTDVNDRSIVAGAGINMAQRVMDCGDAGHILLSKRAATDLAEYRQWQPHLHDVGEYEVKHGVVLSLVNLYTGELGNPEVPTKVRLTAAKSAATAVATARASARGKRARIWAIALLVIAIPLGVGFWIATHRTAPGLPLAGIPEKSIAILPLENLSRDPDNAYFVIGIQDEILTRLAKIADLKVISRTSTQHYKSAPENLAEIARQLRSEER